MTSARELHQDERQAEKAKYTRQQLEEWGVVPRFGEPLVQRLRPTLLILDSLYTFREQSSPQQRDAARKLFEELKEKLKDKKMPAILLTKAPRRVSDYSILDTYRSW